MEYSVARRVDRKLGQSRDALQAWMDSLRAYPKPKARVSLKPAPAPAGLPARPLAARQVCPVPPAASAEPPAQGGLPPARVPARVPALGPDLVPEQHSIAPEPASPRPRHKTVQMQARPPVNRDERRDRRANVVGDDLPQERRPEDLRATDPAPAVEANGLANALAGAGPVAAGPAPASPQAPLASLAAAAAHGLAQPAPSKDDFLSANARRAPDLSADSSASTKASLRSFVKNALYLVPRAVNFVLALGATILTFGKAMPLLVYTVDRLGESLGVEPAIKNGASTARATGEKPATPVVDDKTRTTLERLDKLHLRTLKKAQLRSLRGQVIGRSAQVGIAVVVGGVGLAAMAAFPPLAIVGLVSAGVLLWNGIPNLRVARKNLRAAEQGLPTQPLGSSAVANAWFRGLKGSEPGARPEAREAARMEAARGGRWIAYLVNFFALGAGLPGAIIAPVAAAAVFAKKLSRSVLSTAAGWIAEKFGMNTTRVLRAQAQEGLNTLLARYRGSVLPQALKDELARKWKISEEDLLAWHSGTQPLVLRADDVSGVLNGTTHVGAGASLVRTAVDAGVFIGRQ